MYTGKTETFMAAVWCYLFTRIFHICPSRNWKTTRESVWVKVFANKTSHYVASWYRQPGGTSEDFQLFRDQLDHIRNQHKGKSFPSVHVLGDFNFTDIDWPDRLNKLGSALSQSEGQMLIDIMNDHGLEQLVHFPTREKIHWIYYSLLFLVSFWIFTHRTNSVIMILLLELWKLSFNPPSQPRPPIKTPRRKVYLYQKGDYESMRKDAFEFAKEKYFNGYPDTRSVQENFNLITSFIQDSADKQIPSKTSRTVSSVPWITSEIRRKIRRRNKTHAKAKKTGNKKLRSKFETLRREIKDDVRKQHHLYVNNLVGDVKANPRDFYRYNKNQKKDNQGILKRRGGTGITASEIEQSEEFNGQFTDVSTKMIIVRSHFSVGRPLSWMTLLFQMRV